MDNTTFRKSVLRTEAPVTHELIERAKEPNVIRALYVELAILVDVAEKLDKIKKYIFYNKANSDLVFGDNTTLPESVKEKLDISGIRTLHSILGICTEAGEISNQLLTHLFENKDLDTINLVEELGDLGWYEEILLDNLNSTRHKIQQINSDKLRARYPEKFTEVNANVRDLDAERKTLESV